MLYWSILVVIATIIIEIVGVETGMIFGEYIYSSVLQSLIKNVPLAIGFAWLGMLFSTTTLTQRIYIERFSVKPIMAAAIVALLMVLFDWILEPAAIELNYWQWSKSGIPLQNYLAWFVFSFIFSFPGNKLKIFDFKLPAIALHAFFAQIIYFVIIILF